MKRHYFLIALLSIISFNYVQAQKKTTMDLLTAHAWVNSDSTYFVKFDNEIFYSYSNHVGLKRVSNSRNYYLSNTDNFIPESTKIDFKTSLIGKVQNGMYIITSNRVFWIKEISENSLIFIATAHGGPLLEMVPYYGVFPE